METNTKPITQAQKKLMEDLLTTRVIPQEVKDRGFSKLPTMSCSKAHQSISWLLRQPTGTAADDAKFLKPVETTTQPTVVTVVAGTGFYVDAAGAVYSCSKFHGKLVWRRFVQISAKIWKYRRINGWTAKQNVNAGGHRMSKDEAQAFGKLHGICVCCGRLLSNPESIELGIGPICAGKTVWANIVHEGFGND